MIHPLFRSFVVDELRALTLETFPIDDFMGRLTVTGVDVEIELPPEDPAEARRRGDTWGVRRGVLVDILVRREDGHGDPDEHTPSNEGTTHRRRWDLGVFPALGSDGTLVIDGQDYRIDAPEVARAPAERYVEHLRKEATRFGWAAKEQAALSLSSEFLERSSFPYEPGGEVVHATEMDRRRRLFDLTRRIGARADAIARPGVEVELGPESWFAGAHERIDLPFGDGWLVVSLDPKTRRLPRECRPDGQRMPWYVRWLATDRRRLRRGVDSRSWGFPILVVDDDDGAVYARFGEGWSVEVEDGTTYATLGGGHETAKDWVRIADDLLDVLAGLANRGAGYWVDLPAWRERAD